jgi:hypothetical protein
VKRSSYQETGVYVGHGRVRAEWDRPRSCPTGAQARGSTRAYIVYVTIEPVSKPEGPLLTSSRHWNRKAFRSVAIDRRPRIGSPSRRSLFSNARNGAQIVARGDGG